MGSLRLNILAPCSFQVILNTGMLAADSAGRPDRAYRLLRAMQELNVEADVVSITTLGSTLCKVCSRLATSKAGVKTGCPKLDR